MNERATDITAEMSETDEVLLLLNEAISLGRRDGMCGQHLGAMCSARDEIERLRAELADAKAAIAALKRASDDQDRMDDSCGR